MSALQTTISPRLRGQIQTALEALDTLIAEADAACLFELRAIANHVFYQLDAYIAERDDRPEAPTCESCNAGWHEEPAAKAGCACACHSVAHHEPPRIPSGREAAMPVLGRIA